MICQGGCEHDFHLLACASPGCTCKPNYKISGCRDPEPMTLASRSVYEKELRKQ